MQSGGGIEADSSRSGACVPRRRADDDWRGWRMSPQLGRIQRCIFRRIDMWLIILLGLARSFVPLPAGRRCRGPGAADARERRQPPTTRARTPGRDGTVCSRPGRCRWRRHGELLWERRMNRQGPETSGGSNGRSRGGPSFWVASSPRPLPACLNLERMQQRAIHALTRLLRACWSARQPSRQRWGTSSEQKTTLMLI